jgi:hypothetical protein
MSEDNQGFSIRIPSEPGKTPSPNRGRGTSRRAKAAVRRCCAAWWRAYKEYMDRHDNDFLEQPYASQNAATAYFNAMPLLSGEDNIRDFIACVTHGIITDVLPNERCGQILYAAQVALAAQQRKSTLPTPSTRKSRKEQPLDEPQTDAPKRLTPAVPVTDR